MPAADGLQVNNVNVRDEPQFVSGGRVVTKTVLTFYVGGHGPFRETFDKEQATSAALKSAIDAQVRLLRDVTA